MPTASCRHLTQNTERVFWNSLYGKIIGCSVIGKYACCYFLCIIRNTKPPTPGIGTPTPSVPERSLKYATGLEILAFRRTARIVNGWYLRRQKHHFIAHLKIYVTFGRILLGRNRQNIPYLNYAKKVRNIVCHVIFKVIQGIISELNSLSTVTGARMRARILKPLRCTVR